MSAHHDLLEKFALEQYLQLTEAGDFDPDTAPGHAENIPSSELGDTHVGGARRHARYMPPPVVVPHGNVAFADFALETQRQIVGHMDRKDLLVFQRLSRHCLSLASAEIYRNLDLDLNSYAGDGDSGIPGLHAADALQTILTSEHNYGQHIKSFRLGVFDDRAEMVVGHPGRTDPLLLTRLLWDSKSDPSKFLNTALLLMARKANIMETFQWDVPIEMSGAVYQALHKITSLKHLRVRLDVSQLSKMVIRHGPLSGHQPPTGLQQTQSLSIPLPPPPVGGLGSYPSQTGAKSSNIKRKKAGGNGGSNYWANSRAFSGFKHLSTLALMGVSSLECLHEVAECIKASSATIKSLTMTLSTDLARKAQKPVPINPDLDDLSETELDEDDELLNDPMNGPPPPSQPAPPANEADIRKEKLAQENILARIFDLQSVAAEGKKIEKNLSLPAAQILSEQDTEVITKKVNTIMKSLMDAPIAADADPTASASRLDHFKMIREVADLYITSQNVQKKLSKNQTKPSAPSNKKATSSSKPLNPLASDFKQSGFTVQTPGFKSEWDMDFSTMTSPTSPFAEGANASPFSNMPEKPQAPVGFWPSTSSQGNKINNAMTSTSHNDAFSNYKSKFSASPSNNTFSKPKSTVSASSSTTQQLMEQKASVLKAMQAHQAQAQAQMSPYGTASHAAPQMPSIAPTPYQSNYGGSMFHDASGLYNPYQPTSSNGTPFTGLPPFGSPDHMHPQYENGLSKHPKKIKVKAQKPKTQAPGKAPMYADTEHTSDKAPKKSPASPKPFFSADPASGPLEEAMDIDIEHPDEEGEDLGEDQESVPEIEEVDVPTPRKRAKFEEIEYDPTTAASNEPSSSAQAKPAPAVEVVSSDDAMHAYIRTAHGLQLESLCLEWVPLKGSIVARALDLSVLKRVTLLEVGQQDAFWTLLVRLQNHSPEISFKSIHTDNVSLPFMRFLATFEGLEELFMHERGIKHTEDTTAGPPISITIIRKLALQKHVKTLKRLMIRNERNDSWDVDTKTLQYLAAKGKELKELGLSMNMITYHVLMCYFAAFKNLYALHLIALRSGDRGRMLQDESMSFAIDSLSHFPDMKLKYIAIASSVVEIFSKPDYMKIPSLTTLQKIRDRKGKGKGKGTGKGKAMPDTIESMFEQEDDEMEDEVEGALMTMDSGHRKLKSPVFFGEVRDVRIFERQIRQGRL